MTTADPKLLKHRLQPPPRKPGWMSYDEFLAWAAANGTSTRPIGRFEESPIGRAKNDKQCRNPMGQVEP